MPILEKNGRFEEKDDELVLNITSLQNLSDLQVECQMRTIHVGLERTGEVWAGYAGVDRTHM